MAVLKSKVNLLTRGNVLGSVSLLVVTFDMLRLMTVSNLVVAIATNDSVPPKCRVPLTLARETFFLGPILGTFLPGRNLGLLALLAGMRTWLTSLWTLLLPPRETIMAGLILWVMVRPVLVARPFRPALLA